VNEWQHDHQWDFFIVHANAEPDNHVASRLYALLSGRRDVFLDVNCLTLGENWDEALPRAQRSSKITVVLVSPNTKESYYQHEEIASAIELARTDAARHTVVPLYLDMDEQTRRSSVPYGLHRKVGLHVNSSDDLIDVVRQLLALLPPRPEQPAGGLIPGTVPASQTTHLTPVEVSTPETPHPLTTGEKVVMLVVGVVVGVPLVFLIGFLADLTFGAVREGFAEDKAAVIDVSGTDDGHLSADFRIIVLSREYYWKLGHSDLVIDKRGQEVPILEKLTSSGIAVTIAQMTDVIAVGLASCIGAAYEEVARASDRTDQLVAWLREVPTRADTGLYSLNLGQFDEACGPGSGEREQRTVLLVGIVSKQAGVDLPGSFRDALYKARKRVFRRVDLTRYTNWPEGLFRQSFVNEK
jgi:hypothetical protein